MNRIEWVYSYDENGNRTGLCEARQKPKPRKHCKHNVFNDVWIWGNALGDMSAKGKLISYADRLIGSQWDVMRIVTRKEFYRTLELWQKRLYQRNGDIDLLCEVLKYDIIAKRLKIKDVQEYIAKRVDRTQPAVHKYLQMIDMKAMQSELSSNYLYNDLKTASIIDSSKTTWKPSKSVIDLKRASIPRACAAGYDRCKGNTQTGKLSLCKSCHIKVISEGRGLPEWLHSEMVRIRREHYKQAVNACFEDHYGSMSESEQLSYLDAI